MMGCLARAGRWAAAMAMRRCDVPCSRCPESAPVLRLVPPSLCLSCVLTSADVRSVGAPAGPFTPPEAAAPPAAQPTCQPPPPRKRFRSFYSANHSLAAVGSASEGRAFAGVTLGSRQGRRRGQRSPAPQPSPKEEENDDVPPKTSIYRRGHGRGGF